MKIDLQDLCGSAVLAGALSGRTALNRLLTHTAQEPVGPEPVFLDFSGIEVATASFLRESVLAFRDIIRGRRSAFYPVVANAGEVVRDELMELLRPRGDVLMTCTLTDDGAVRNAVPLGELDPKQGLTFDLVRQLGETDAGALMRGYGESEGLKHTTAWNNRLAALAARGLIIEQSHGRAKRYRPIF
ncbi:MAG: STAS-like domain-containing protein [Hyphomonas sp.]|nr:STAS-like domain-containing protein [Hyphomonas sp.]